MHFESRPEVNFLAQKDSQAAIRFDRVILQKTLRGYLFEIRFLARPRDYRETVVTRATLRPVRN